MLIFAPFFLFQYRPLLTEVNKAMSSKLFGFFFQIKTDCFSHNWVHWKTSPRADCWRTKYFLIRPWKVPLLSFSVLHGSEHPHLHFLCCRVVLQLQMADQRTRSSLLDKMVGAWKPQRRRVAGSRTSPPSIYHAEREWQPLSMLPFLRPRETWASASGCKEVEESVWSELALKVMGITCLSSVNEGNSSQ